MEGFIQNSPDWKELGWRITDYLHPGGGTLRMQQYQSLSRLISTTAAVIVIDPDLIGARTLRTRDTKYHTAALDSNFVDGIIGEFIAEKGLSVKGITASTAAHGFLYGITGAAA